MLRDFNARVRQRDRESDLWKGTLRVHGLDERNDAGGEFLEFCSINDLTIMNSSFKKEELHLGTWMYAATKRYHIIDYVVLRSNQRRVCTDVQVMHESNCWSDHSMVRAKISAHITQPQSKTKPR